MNLSKKETRKRLLKKLLVVLVICSTLLQPVAASTSTTTDKVEQTESSKGNTTKNRKKLIVNSLIFALLFFCFMAGYKLGLFVQVVGLSSLRVFAFFKDNLKEPIVFVLKMIGFEEGSKLIGVTTTILILFFGFFLIATLDSIIRFILRVLFLGHLNSMLGGILGLLEGFTLLACAIVMLESLNISLPEGMIVSVDEAKYIAERMLGGEFLEECKEFMSSVKDFTKSLHNNLIS